MSKPFNYYYHTLQSDKSEWDQETRIYLSAFQNDTDIFVGRVAIGNLQSKYACIYDFFVAPEHRRRGVGKTLILGCLLSAKLEKCTAVTLDVNRKNWDAIRLYVHLGFRCMRERTGTDDTYVLFLNNA